jgi:hypothetical protein
MVPGTILKETASGERWAVVRLREVARDPEFKGRTIAVLRSLDRDGVYEARDLAGIKPPSWTVLEEGLEAADM